MTVLNNISAYGQSLAQSSRLINLRAQLDEISRQATTQQKYDNYAGYGAQAGEVLRLGSQQPLIQTYMNNIDTVSNRLTTMNSALTTISNVGNQLVTGIQTLLTSGGGDSAVSSLRQIAQQGLSTLTSLMNTNIDGHYLFGGANVTTPPYTDDGSLTANTQAFVGNWLASGDTSALTASMNGLNEAQLGFSPGLASSGSVTTRIDDNLDIDYTLRADNPAFTNLLRTLSVIANLPAPDPDTDVATKNQYTGAITSMLETARTAVTQVQGQATDLAGKFNLLKSVKERHQDDLSLIQTRADTLENADPSAALVTLQQLQTQLTASYQVTGILSQLSLVNYIK